MSLVALEGELADTDKLSTKYKFFNIENHYLSPFSVTHLVLSEFKMLSDMHVFSSRLDPTAFYDKMRGPSICQMV